MFYYTIEKHITNIYDANELRIVGHVKCYGDEAKTQLLTELPFGNLGVTISVAECPKGSKEEFDAYIEEKVLEAVNKEEIQSKLTEIKMLKDLGIL